MDDWRRYKQQPLGQSQPPFGWMFFCVVLFLKVKISLKLTAKASLHLKNRAKQTQKERACLPTIHFQGRTCSFQGV